MSCRALRVKVRPSIVVVIVVAVMNSPIEVCSVSAHVRARTRRRRRGARMAAASSNLARRPRHQHQASTANEQAALAAKLAQWNSKKWYVCCVCLRVVEARPTREREHEGTSRLEGEAGRNSRAKVCQQRGPLSWAMDRALLASDERRGARFRHESTPVPCQEWAWNLIALQSRPPHCCSSGVQQAARSCSVAAATRHSYPATRSPLHTESSSHLSQTDSTDHGFGHTGFGYRMRVLRLTSRAGSSSSPPARTR